MDPKLALLQNAFFADARLDPGSLEELAGALTERCFARGTAIFREGDPAPDMFFVVSGRVGIFKQAGDARVPLAEIGPGGYFGEIALVDGGHRSADAEALEDVESLALEDALFDDLLERAPRLAVFFLKATSKRLRALSPQPAKPEQARAPDRIADDYPFPIAAVYRSMSVTADPRPRLERFFDLLEVTIRYLGIVAVAHYLAGEKRDGRIDDFVEKTFGTLGVWLSMVRLVPALYAVEPGSLFIPELLSVATNPAGGASRVAALLFTILDFRNAQRHGAGGAMTDAAIAAALDKHEPGLRELLAELRFVADYPLIFLERMSFSRGAFNYRYQRCMGSHADFPTASMTLKDPLETGHAYLLHPSGERVLPLFPLVLIDGCTVCAHREVFFVTRQLPAAADYIEFRRGHHLAASAPMDSLGQIRAEVLERRKARVTTREQLALASSAELAKALGSSEAPTRLAAARTLAARGERSATPAFVRALDKALSDADAEMAILACKILGTLADGRALDVLLRAASQPEQPFAPAAIDALGKLKRKEALPALSSALAQPALRAKAVRAIAHLGDPGRRRGVIEAAGVIRDDHGRPISFLPAELKGTPSPGEHVTFLAYDGPDGPAAAGVQRTASAAPALGPGTEARGVVRWFDRAKARGFIRDDDTGKDVLVQGAELSLRARQRVRYQRVQTPKGFRATNVVDDAT